MLLKKHLLILLLLIPYQIIAHKSDEAFFNITSKGSQTEIEVEFPWSLRNALLLFNPGLNKSHKKEDFERTFQDYVKETLVLTNSQGEIFPFIDFWEIQKGGHSHHNTYLLRFEGINLRKVSNTLLFNLNKTQTNYHVILNGSEQITFTTTKESPTYSLPTSSHFQYWWLLILFIPLILLVKKKFS